MKKLDHFRIESNGESFRVERQFSYETTEGFLFWKKKVEHTVWQLFTKKEETPTTVNGVHIYAYVPIVYTSIEAARAHIKNCLEFEARQKKLENWQMVEYINRASFNL